MDKFTGRADPIRIIGDPDNHCPDTWSSTVVEEKSVPMPLCPPQIPQRLAWDRTRFHGVTGRKLTS